LIGASDLQACRKGREMQKPSAPRGRPKVHEAPSCHGFPSARNTGTAGIRERSSGSRVVLLGPAFPFAHIGRTVAWLGLSSSLTAAGPRRIFTAFPVPGSLIQLSGVSIPRIRPPSSAMANGGNRDSAKFSVDIRRHHTGECSSSHPLVYAELGGCNVRRKDRSHPPPSVLPRPTGLQVRRPAFWLSVGLATVATATTIIYFACGSVAPRLIATQEVPVPLPYTAPARQVLTLDALLAKTPDELIGVDNPAARSDPLGLDFIALSDRAVGGWWNVGNLFRYYSIEYWKCECEVEEGAQYKVEDFKEANPQCTDIQSVELQRSPGWKVWKFVRNSRFS
jgi:hypothetical protein